MFEPREVDIDFPSRKQELEGKNRTVKRPIERLKKELKGGRKKKYTPTRMLNAINKYFKWCEDNDEVPSISGLCIQLGFNSQYFYKYLAYPEFTEIMEQARLHIKNWCEVDVYNSKGLIAGKSLYMKSLHGWQDRTTTETINTTIVMTPEMAKAKIEMLAPQLLEILKSSRLLEGFASKQEIDITPNRELTKD